MELEQRVGECIQARRAASTHERTHIKSYVWTPPAHFVARGIAASTHHRHIAVIKASTMSSSYIVARTRTCWIVWLVVLCQWVGWSSAFARQRADIAARRASLLVAGSSAIDDFDELPQDFPRRNDALVALKAVRKACQVTNKLQPESFNDGISTVEKADLSPVTVGDFACQASVLGDLHAAFPEDSFIAEESSAALDEDVDLAEQVLAASSLSDVEQVKHAIDLGKDYLHWEQRGGRPPRVWCLDPIDGTRGFLRGKQQGGQYCIALALLEVRKQNVSTLTFELRVG